VIENIELTYSHDFCSQTQRILELRRRGGIHSRPEQRRVVPMTEERRKHKRFEVRSGAFASLHPHLTVMGPITTVSRGGLSFRYVGSEKLTEESSSLNMLLTDGTFRLQRIPVNTIWDCPAPLDCFVGRACLRCCGVRFGDMTDQQQSALEHFLKTCVTGPRATANISMTSPTGGHLQTPARRT